MALLLSSAGWLQDHFALNKLPELTPYLMATSMPKQGRHVHHWQQALRSHIGSLAFKKQIPIPTAPQPLKET